MASTDSPPSARVWPFTASVGNVVYLWGGDGDTEPDAVFLFCRDTKTWARQRTRGPHPPAGLNGGGCCISGQHLYIYGGYDGESRYGTLYELNTKSWTWRKLSDDGAAGGPGKKNGCRIIRYQDRLLVVGGYYIERPRRQAGSSYENGWTNEVHCFNLTTGKRKPFLFFVGSNSQSKSSVYRTYCCTILELILTLLLTTPIPRGEWGRWGGRQVQSYIAILLGFWLHNI